MTLTSSQSPSPTLTDGADTAAPASAAASLPVSAPASGEAVADVDVLDSHEPLSTREALDRRVRQLVPCAVQRQLWLLLFDADHVQLPVMIPIGDLPLRCQSADGEGLAELLASLHREFPVDSFVFVLERPGDAKPDATDLAWLIFLLAAAEGRPYVVRAAYLAHDGGVVGYEGADLPELASVSPQSRPGGASSRMSCGASGASSAAETSTPRASTP